MKRSKARYGVVGFCFALAMVTYIDRACIGVLAGTIRADLGLSMTQMGYVFSAFTFAYAIFEIPSAWWGEKIGARQVLARIVVWWSAFTMLTAAATGFVSLWLIRFLFGAGEAGAWPNATRVFSRWIPVTERGRVQGIFFSGAHLAAGLTPPLVLFLLQYVGWRSLFLIFGSLGFLWALAWLRWFRDLPADHPGVNEAELNHINSGVRAEPAGHAVAIDGAMMRSLLTNPNVWLLSVVAFANSYGFYFVITWLPTFLGTLGFSKASLALYSGLPMLFAVPADLLGGVTTDFLARRFGLRLGRALVGGIAYAVAAGAMFAATQYTNNPHVAAILLATAGGASMFALAASWASCMEIGTAQSGLASATMNTIGQVGAMLSPIVSAWLVERSGAAGRWELPLQIIASLYLVSALCWIFINPKNRSRV
jgi:ACS family glucarate transporter-like MFS transporter